MENKFKQTLVALKEALQLKESTKVSYKNYKDEKEEVTLTGDIEKVHKFLLANNFDFENIAIDYDRDRGGRGKAIDIAAYTRKANGNDYYIEVWYIPESGKLDSAVFTEDYKEDYRRDIAIESVDEFKEEFAEWIVDFGIAD